MKSKTEAQAFDEAMDKLLKADPKIVKAVMEQEKNEREEARKAKRAVLDHASSDRD